MNAEPGGRAFHRRIRSDPRELRACREAVERLALDAGFERRAADELGLCVNEALANVMRHAYAGAADRPIDLSAEFDADRLTVRIRDWGSGVDPTTLPPRPPDPLRPGGLGLVCMRQMLDDMVFAPQPDGMLLTMVRARRT